ncbi:MAG: LPS-assembly protein LptD, partial [Alphaproteobacteria bacterium]
LTADRVHYDQRNKIVRAFGNVAVSDPSGPTVFAEMVELTDDLKDGVIRQFGILFADKTRLAAADAERKEGQKTQMNKVVFSPCNLCADDPTRAPLWQITARRVLHDQTSHEIYYYDAFFEVYGVPIMYMPYFSHADPTIKRSTGFLPPVFGSNSQLGSWIRTPYFIVIDEATDVTITPMITTQERVALFLEGRRRFKDGYLEMSGSYTRVRRRDDFGNKVDGDMDRGHFFGRGLYEIDENWRAVADWKVSSDSTYARRYSINYDRTLTSTAYVEGFHDRNYTQLRGYYFQGQTVDNDNQRTTPVILPYAEHSRVGQPVGRWGRYELDVNMVGISRIEGVNSRRFSVRGGWELPYTAPEGYTITASATVNGDLYWVDGLPRTGTSDFSGTVGRLYPQFILDWRYPFVRELGNVRHIIEPRVGIVFAPKGLNSKRIPNEDSLDVEFDDSNLFAANRFPGFDKVEEGIRIVYGINNIFYGNLGGRTEIFVGQSYRFDASDEFVVGSGLERHLSHFVGRISVQPAPWLNVVYRFRLDDQNFQFRRNELAAFVGPPALNAAVSYIRLDESVGNGQFEKREQVSGTIRFRWDENWSGYVSGIYNLSHSDNEGPGWRGWGFGGRYDNECCSALLDFRRSFTTDRDIKPSTAVIFTIVFKHLGEVQGRF